MKNTSISYDQAVNLTNMIMTLTARIEEIGADNNKHYTDLNAFLCKLNNEFMRDRQLLKNDMIDIKDEFKVLKNSYDKLSLYVDQWQKKQLAIFSSISGAIGALISFVFMYFDKIKFFGVRLIKVFT